ncbi:YjeF N-terminal domain-containing protein 3 [Takifugu flavidus]|uniref:YjeF N-terminal domain-containing protein 3 n=1 Tax=Takifugu flavidus TaxID=433684 RepID=A0A5C6MR55_9TELE|nr:YjeF N-terminal domain-containing protein 3 [Takifugu flavidus]
MTSRRVPPVKAAAVLGHAMRSSASRLALGGHALARAVLQDPFPPLHAGPRGRVLRFYWAGTIIYEYEPTIYLPKRSTQSLHQDFTVQCEKMDIPFLSYLPTEVQLINDAYNLLIDAMLGPEADCSNIKEPYSGILVTLKQVNVPIVSVDVPSGWDAEEPSQGGISPDVLISLTAPKKCAMSFSGKHFLAGRFLPYDIQKKYELNIPEYPGTDCTIEL